MGRSVHQKVEGARGLPPPSAVGWFVECRMGDGRFVPEEADRLAEEATRIEVAPSRHAHLIRPGSRLVLLRDWAVATTRALGFARHPGSRRAQGK